MLIYDGLIDFVFKTEAPILCPPNVKSQFIGKDLGTGKD